VAIVSRPRIKCRRNRWSVQYCRLCSDADKVGDEVYCREEGSSAHTRIQDCLRS
jgi:hypothetical protein